MTKFDSFIKELFQEMGNQGEGPLANQGPAVGNSSSPTSSSDTGSATKVNLSKNIPTTTQQGQSHNELDMGNLLKNQNTVKWKDFLKDPNNANALRAHILNVSLNPDSKPEDKTNLARAINSNSDLKNYFTNLRTQLSQPLK